MYVEEKRKNTRIKKVRPHCVFELGAISLGFIHCELNCSLSLWGAIIADYYKFQKYTMCSAYSIHDQCAHSQSVHVHPKVPIYIHVYIQCM